MRAIVGSLKQGLMAKGMEEKAIAQSAELRSQVAQIHTELRCVVARADKRTEAVEGCVSELEAGFNGHMDSITSVESDIAFFCLFVK